MFYTSEYLRPQEPNKSSILIYGMSQVVSFHPYAPLWGHVTWNQELQSSEAWSGKRHGQARARHLSEDRTTWFLYYASKKKKKRRWHSYHLVQDRNLSALPNILILDGKQLLKNTEWQWFLFGIALWVYWGQWRAYCYLHRSGTWDLHISRRF